MKRFMIQWTAVTTALLLIVPAYAGAQISHTANRAFRLPAPLCAFDAMPMQSVSIAPQADVLTYGQTLSINVTGLPASADTITLFLSDGTFLAASAAYNSKAVLTYDTAQKGIPIGTSTLVAAYGSNGSLADSTRLGTVQITLNKKKLTAVVPSKQKKDYNGTSYFSDIALTLSGVIAGDDVTATASGTTADVNVCKVTAFTATSSQLEGAHKDWYLAPDNISGKIIITQIDPAFSADNISCQPQGQNVNLNATIHITNPIGATAGFPDAGCIRASISSYEADNVSLAEAPGVYLVSFHLPAPVADSLTLTLGIDDPSGNYTAVPADIILSSLSKSSTKTVLTCSDYAPTYGGPVSFTAAVTDVQSGNSIPAGTVQFYQDRMDNTGKLGDAVPLISGSATQSLTTPVFGQHTYFAEFISTDPAYADSSSQPLSLSFSPKSVSIVGLTANSRIYDGTLSVSLSGGRLAGVLPGDDVSAAMPAVGTVADANAGAGKPVYIPLPPLTGPNADRYTLEKVPQLTASILPAGITIADTSIEPKSYDGKTAVKVVDVTFAGLKNNETLTLGTDYSASGVLDCAEAGVRQSAAISAALSDTDKAQNYTIANNPYTVEFLVEKSPSDTLIPSQGTLSVLNHHEKTYHYDLSQLLPALPSGQSLGPVSYTLDSKIDLGEYYTGGAKITGSNLSLPIAAAEGAQPGWLGDIAVTIRCQNFQDISAVLSVHITHVPIPTGAPTLSRSTLTYGEMLSVIGLSGTMSVDGHAVPGVFAWDFPSLRPNAGSCPAAWTFTPSDTIRYAPAAGISLITVHRAQPAGSPGFTAINASGQTLLSANLTTGTISPSGSIQWDAPASTPVQANQAYGWTFTADDSNNYEILTGSIVPWIEKENGGDNPPVIDPENPSGGSRPASSASSGSSKSAVEVITSGGVTTAVTAVQASSRSGAVSAEISRATLRHILAEAAQAEGENPLAVVIKITDRSMVPVRSVRITIASAALQQVANSKIKSLSISSQLGAFELSRQTAALLAARSGEAPITLHISRCDTIAGLSEAVAVYEILICKDRTPLADLSDCPLSVALPYVLAGQDAGNAAVWRMDGRGIHERLSTTCTGANAVFPLSQSSLYFIAPAQDGMQANSGGTRQGASLHKISPSASLSHQLAARTMVIAMLRHITDRRQFVGDGDPAQVRTNAIR